MSVENGPELHPRHTEHQPVKLTQMLTAEDYEDTLYLLDGVEVPHPDLKHGVWVFRHSDHAKTAAAWLKVKIAEKNPYSLFINPTGATYEDIHAQVAELVKNSTASFRNTWATHLDEYTPYPSDGTYSFARYIRERVVEPLGIRENHVRYINGLPEAMSVETYDHEDWIRKHSPVALQQFGLGPDGHLAFIQPGTPFDTPTHQVSLTRETLDRDRNERHQDTPAFAITVGPKTIIDTARDGHTHVVLFGELKGTRLNEALTGDVSRRHTASLLRQPVVSHGLLIMTDREAARAFTWPEARAMEHVIFQK